MIKKNAVLAALAAAVCLTVAGCGQKAEPGTWNADENSIYVTENMEVESALLYTSEKANEFYTQEGLAEHVKEAVSAYNQEQGAAAAAENGEGADKLPVALKSCTLEGQTGTLVFAYKTPEDFLRFAKETGDNTHTITSLSIGKVADVSASGTLADAVFLTAEGKSADTAAVEKNPEAHVIAVDGAATVYTERKITYVTDGIMMKSGTCAVTSEGKNLIVFE